MNLPRSKIRARSPKPARGRFRFWRTGLTARLSFCSIPLAQETATTCGPPEYPSSLATRQSSSGTPWLARRERGAGANQEKHNGTQERQEDSQDDRQGSQQAGDEDRRREGQEGQGALMLDREVLWTEIWAIREAMSPFFAKGDYTSAELRRLYDMNQALSWAVGEGCAAPTNHLAKVGLCKALHDSDAPAHINRQDGGIVFEAPQGDGDGDGGG